MDRNRLWMIGAIVVMGAAIGLGWLLGISPQLEAAAAANTTRAQVETQNAGYEQKLVALKKQFENIGDLQTELAQLRKSVPSEGAIPAFVGQLDAISKEHKVELTGISVSDGQPYVPPAPPAAPAADAAAGATPAPAPAPAAGAEPAAAVDPAVKLITADNFVAIPISLTVNGDYSRVLDFIKGVQTGTRLVLVTAFNTTAASAGAGGTASDPGAASTESGSAVTANISAYVYVLLDPAKVPAPAADAPAGTDTQAAG